MKSLLFISLIAISATAVNAQCPPVPVITGSHALCGDDYVMVTATNLPASAFMLYWYRDGIFYSNNNPGSLMHDAGTYTVKTYSNGCYSALSDPFVLTQYQRPTLTSEGNVTSICPTGGTVNLIVTGGTAPYSWTLNGNVIPGAITATYAATTGGSYYVYSGSPSSCGASTGINLWTVTVPTNVVLSSALPIACGPTNMASVTISSSMAGASFTLYKDGIAHNTNLTSTAAAPAGTYLAKWNNPNGCEVSSNTLVIAPNTNPTPVITPGEGSTFCRGTALTVSNVGTTYQWFMGNATQGGETSPSTIPYMSDLWRVRVGFANGCFTTVEVNVTVNQLPIVSVQRYGSDPNCGPQVLRASTNGGSGTNSYKWFRDGIEIAGAISYDYTANQSGNYVAAITRNGCVGTNTPFTFTYNPIPSLSLTADGPTSFCQGGAVTLTASGGTAPYVWKRDGAIMSGVTGSSYTVTNPINMTNRYSVTWTTPAGCSATSNLIYVSIMPTTQIYVTNLTGNGCNSEGVNLQTNYGGIGGWIWKKDGVVIEGQNNPDIHVNNSGSYTANSNAPAWTCHIESPPVVVNTTPHSNIITAGGPTTFCDGGSVTLSAPVAPAGKVYTYQWRKNNLDIATTEGTLQQYPAVTGGSYTCTIKQVGWSCNAFSNAIIVTVNLLPTPTITALTPTTICTSGSITLRVSGGATYWWRFNGTRVGSETTATDQTFSAAGDYSVDAISAEGCPKTSGKITFTTNAVPAIPIVSPTGPITMCQGLTATLTTPNNGNTFKWYRGTTEVGSGNSYAATSSGSYSVISKNSFTCTAQSATVVVTVNPLPGASITPLTSGICPGGPGTLTASPSSGVTYKWYRNSLLVSGTASTFPLTDGGSYKVVTTNPSGCSSTSAEAYVTTISPPSTPVITQSNNCTGGTATLSGNVSGSAYQWSTGATTSSISISTTGTYTLRVKNSSGCWSSYGSITISSLASPNFALTKTGNLCTDGQVTISVVNVVGTVQSRSWSPPSGSAATIVVYGAGTYTCKITFAGGCQVSRSVSVPTPSGNCHIPLRTADNTPTEIPSEELDVQVTETSFFPNPADREINLTTPAASIARKISLINMQGVEVHTSIMPPATTSTRIPLGSLSDGMYLLQIQSPTTVERLKVIINQKR